MVLSIRLTNDSRAELACASPLQRRAIDADDLELALHYKNATTVLLQRAELLGDGGAATQSAKPPCHQSVGWVSTIHWMARDGT